MIVDFSALPSVLINATSQPARLEKVSRLFDRLGFEHFFRQEVIPHQSVKISIALSQIAAMVRFKPPFAVYEDDVNINPIVSSFTLQIPDDADVVYTGVSTIGAHCALNMEHGAVFHQVDNVVSKVWETFCAHSVVYMTQRAVNAKISALAQSIATRINQDVVSVRQLSTLNTYALNDPIFFQDDGPERISQTLFNIPQYLAKWKSKCPVCGVDLKK